jgi:hypothetical protein
MNQQVKDSAATRLDTVIVGQGRLGRLIRGKLKQSVTVASLDESKGILIDTPPSIDVQAAINNQSSGEKKLPLLLIKRLIVCISAKPRLRQPSVLDPNAVEVLSERRRWSWHTIFNGIEAQINSQQLRIDSLIFVSSTRVYDGIERGVVTASTEPLAGSLRASTLIHAEQQIARLAAQFHIVRCSGLYGNGYHTFQQILETSEDGKLRFGVNINQVAEKIEQLTRVVENFSSIELLTDGYCYKNGIKLDLTENAIMASQQRYLKASRWVIDD